MVFPFSSILNLDTIPRDFSQASAGSTLSSEMYIKAGSAGVHSGKSNYGPQKSSAGMVVSTRLSSLTLVLDD